MDPEVAEVGARAEHWCMYFRDLGEHAFVEHWKHGLVCQGCGSTPPKNQIKKKL